jgi:gliding motility-associated-like protein
MKKIIFILTSLVFLANAVGAQQIKRQTLASVGKLKVAEPFRVSWTAGSCPGCSVIHPSTPAGAGYLRQGFQQPPFNGNAPNCPPIMPVFTIMSFPSPTCGTKFDMEFAGLTVPNMTVEWNFGEGAVPQTSTQLNPTNVIYTTSGIKIITLKVSSGAACSDTRAKTVSVTPAQIGFSATTSVTNIKCRNDKTGEVTLSTIGGSGTKTYRWSNGATTQNLTAAPAGRYTVTITDGSGCSFSSDSAVITQPNLALGFTAIITKEACKNTEDGSIELTPTGGTPPYKISWSTGATTSRITALSVGSYRATILDSNLCRLDTSLIIAYGCRDTTKSIYDIITPNKDGINDKWIVPTIEKYPDNEMFIYNRWGQLIYTTKKYLNDWAGTNQEGKELPTGAYYYIINLNDGNNTKWKGSVTVLR